MLIFPPTSCPLQTHLRLAYWWRLTNQLLRLPLLMAILEKIEAYYETAVQGKSPQPAWNQRLINIGKPVQVSTGTDKVSITGIVEGTDVWGQLLVRDEQNSRSQPVAAGDVTLRT